MASAGVLIRPAAFYGCDGHPKSWILGDFFDVCCILFKFYIVIYIYFWVIFKVESEPLQHWSEEPISAKTLEKKRERKTWLNMSEHQSCIKVLSNQTWSSGFVCRAPRQFDNWSSFSRIFPNGYKKGACPISGAAHIMSLVAPNGKPGNRQISTICWVKHHLQTPDHNSHISLERSPNWSTRPVKLRQGYVWTSRWWHHRSGRTVHSYAI